MKKEDDTLPQLQIELMRQFVHRNLEIWPEFIAALITGSVAHGEARTDSDVDCILIFQELNEAFVPAEFVWAPETNTYHTIFEVEASDVGGIQIDAKRLSLNNFRDYEWSEPHYHDLAHALSLYDREGVVGALIRELTTYPEELRLHRIQRHLEWLQYYLEEWRLLGWIDRGGIASAHDQVTAAFEELIQLLHALNGQWLPWRSRWMVSTQQLAWIPSDYSGKAVEITSRISGNKESLLKRHSELVFLVDETVDRLRFEGLDSDPDAVFMATHPGLGYAHNFDSWREEHQKLLETRGVFGATDDPPDRKPSEDHSVTFSSGRGRSSS